MAAFEISEIYELDVANLGIFAPEDYKIEIP